MQHDLLAELVGVYKNYGSTVALDGLDLNVNSGELLAVLGPNGAGKSTAISLLLGLQQPTRGIARLFGESPKAIAVRRRIGVMMQEVTLPVMLKVRELIELVSSYYMDPLPIDQVIEMTDIGSIASRHYGKLSGGQKRQAQFAMAVCGRPQLLFLDEPTVGLDIDARSVMWRTVRELVKQRCSVVLTTHYLEEAEALADRVAVLSKGRLVATGTVKEMLALVARKRISCVTRLTDVEVSTWKGVQSAILESGHLHVIATASDEVLRRLLAADSDLHDVEVKRAGLAEAFTQLTQEEAQ
jgi:ABC-type multidrug transport system ATPase subunit